jgi:bis(5'-nucleosyl)-tetraphosphatase (symmetrical)
MRTIIYGDIHGCLNEFQALRKELNLTKDDREISVGDLLDRGPMSNEVLSYARENSIELVLGNHEYKYIRYQRHHEAFVQRGKANPMRFNEDKMKIFENISAEDMAYLETAPFYKKIDKLTVLHAGITNRIDLNAAQEKELKAVTMIRTLDEEHKPLVYGQTVWNSNFWSEVYDGNQGVIVYGHEAHSKVKKDKHAIGIDTGCVYGNKLTALIVYDTKEPMFNYDIVQVDAKMAYAKKK